MSSGSTTTQFYNQLPGKQESGQPRKTWKRISAAILMPSRSLTQIRPAPLCLRCRRTARTSTGQPAVFTATAPVRIRANAAGRHKDRNDKNTLNPAALFLPKHLQPRQRLIPLPEIPSCACRASSSRFGSSSKRFSRPRRTSRASWSTRRCLVIA